MTFTHLSLLSLTSPENADHVIGLVSAAATTFGGVRQWDIVRNENPSRSCDLVFISAFEDEAAYHRYQDDPAHHALSASVKPYLSGSSGIDFRDTELAHG